MLWKGPASGSPFWAGRDGEQHQGWRMARLQDPEQLILLPPLVTRGEKPPEETQTVGSNRLQGLPRFFYSVEELQDTPFPPPEEKHHDCLTAISCACSVVVVISLLGTVTCIVILIFNEVVPRFCPPHHVECVQVEWPSNPYLRSRVLLLFMGFVILLPIGVASCQSNCVCFRRCAAREKGWWAGLKRALRACARSCFMAAAEVKRLRCCRRRATKVQPSESRTPDGLQRCFGAEEFGNLMIIPVPAPIPKKPAAPGFPRRWVHTALPNFHEVVELNLEGEGGEVARLVLSDPTWHCPPRCERVFRVESSGAWSNYLQLRKAVAQLRRDPELPSPVRRSCLGEDLDPCANEQILFYGTTVEVAEQVQMDAKVPDTADCPRHALLRGFGGGCQFCDRGFLAHEQATEAGYNQENLDAPWAVLVCRVVLGRSLVHSGQPGPRVQREWATGRWGSILIQRDRHQEFLLPPDVRNAAYPEYVVILR